MKRQADISETFEADLQELLAHGRVMQPLPVHVRERALARAQAILTTVAATSPSTAARARNMRLAIAVSLAFAATAVGGAVGALAAIRGRAPRPSAPATSSAKVRQP
jgi:hypothetical protein